MTAPLSADESIGPSEKATLQSTFLEKTGNLHISGRKKEESFNKKQRLEKEERKEFSITITLFRPRLFGPVLLLSSFSLLSEDHKAAKILDSRFSSETSDGSLSVGGDSLGVERTDADRSVGPRG